MLRVYQYEYGIVLTIAINEYWQTNQCVQSFLYYDGILDSSSSADHTANVTHPRFWNVGIRKDPEVPISQTSQSQLCTALAHHALHICISWNI